MSYLLYFSISSESGKKDSIQRLHTQAVDSGKYQCECTLCLARKHYRNITRGYCSTKNIPLPSQKISGNKDTT